MKFIISKITMLVFIIAFLIATTPNSYAAWSSWKNKKESAQKDSKPHFINHDQIQKNVELSSSSEEVSYELTPEQAKLIELLKVLNLTRNSVAKPLAKPVQAPYTIYHPVTVAAAKSIPPAAAMQPIAQRQSAQE